MWDFSTDPEFQAKLDWIDRFLIEEVEPLDVLYPSVSVVYDTRHEKSRAILKPLQQKVREQKLWACHLDPHLGGEGYGQLKLALMNERLGRSLWAPTVFGTAAPDTGNAEILAMFGTQEQKTRYLQPLLDGDIVSCFSMTEPQGGADPRVFTTTAVREGDEWVINGEKWYSSNARYAAFMIVLAVTDPEAPIQNRMSMFIVPQETPGLKIIRNVQHMGEREELDENTEGYLRYNNVRVPLDHMLGEKGGGFAVAQARLGGGRIHHAMRTVGQCQRALDMMCERALSRRTQGTLLAEKGTVQAMLADSQIELESFRLLVIKTAWIIDNSHGDPRKARAHIAMVKVAMAKIYFEIVRRAIHLHGSLGATFETPLAYMWQNVPTMGLADGPTEVHQITVARELLRKYKPAEGLFPSEHLPPKIEAAKARYAHILND
ncbi:acyl-CoA dehydrogenase [Stutzerimonas xanthomarina]|jgi:acyl-CoA dehydrogenase|uniref:Acyl-CoA dehydrogenase n=1 Tax=Stutzerimonas xanthomarina TaxID=271420 RepID=A0A427EAP1_9GAMM|nr:acyl-CoA dehydrogenase family protein [Stutzerimonas xanthomarina]MCW8158414.1 acyl-CoA dehydrogenase [Stutzerimonas stutzeri]RRV13430.1 acyl-CoA dehydrogenase [Stutzerimonas xanthomarina]